MQLLELVENRPAVNERILYQEKVHLCYSVQTTINDDYLPKDDIQ